MTVRIPTISEPISEPVQAQPEVPSPTPPPNEIDVPTYQPYTLAYANSGQTPVQNMAYGDGTPRNAAWENIDSRLYRLERGQQFTRGGRVVVAVPQFKGQTIIAQSTASAPQGNTVASPATGAGQTPTQSAGATPVKIVFPQSLENMPDQI